MLMKDAEDGHKIAMDDFGVDIRLYLLKNIQ